MSTRLARRLPLTDRISYSVGVWDDDVVLSLSLARMESARVADDARACCW